MILEAPTLSSDWFQQALAKAEKRLLAIPRNQRGPAARRAIAAILVARKAAKA